MDSTVDSIKASRQPSAPKGRELKRLTLQVKVITLGVVLFTAMTALVYQIWQHNASQIRNTELELEGLLFSKPVQQLAGLVAQHRGMTAAYLGGDQSFKDRILAKKHEIQEKINEIDPINTRYQDRLHTAPAWNEIKESWEKVDKETFERDGQSSFAIHTSLVLKVLDLHTNLGEESGLLTDSNLGVNYLASLQFESIPLINENLGVMRGKQELLPDKILRISSEQT